MRDPHRDKDLLGNMVEAIDYALAFAKGYDYDTFLVDKKTYFAVVKNMEIVGEAAYQLTNECRDSHPATPWKVIINMRHILVHGYADIVASVLWQTLNVDLEPLKEQLLSYINE